MAGTETKAQRVERLKRELNPWEAYAEIQRFAREGWDAIPPEWLGTYFRWWGIYTQGDGIGAIGGKGGEGKATRHFMVRIRIANGQLQAHQLRTITGCRAWCSYPEINDVGLTALHHEATGELGFAVRVGGGLSTDPRLATRLDAFVRWHEALPVLRAISEIFRDSEVLRQSREKARLKFLFLQHGWTAEKFLAALEERLGRALEHGVPDDPPEDVYRDHVGPHRPKQEGLVYAGVAVLRGRLTPAELRAAADLAERYGTGEVRTTNMQNLLIPHVRRERAGALARELEAARLRLDASPFWRGTVACTGSEFCKLALTETKGFARALVEELESRLPGFDAHGT